jgi:hypothetical protein
MYMMFHFLKITFYYLRLPQHKIIDNEPGSDKIDADNSPEHDLRSGIAVDETMADEPIAHSSGRGCWLSKIGSR